MRAIILKYLCVCVCVGVQVECGLLGNRLIEYIKRNRWTEAKGEL